MLKSIIVAITISIMIFLTVMWLLSIIWIVTPFRPFKRLCHDIFGWHEPSENGAKSFDGASFHAKCWFCDKEIMQDSQGNWF